LEPNISEAEIARLKHVVIVGGGPTGVEFGAELYDFCKGVSAYDFKWHKSNGFFFN
jgi:NADH dehydrogenase FAD-containing subunit